MTPSEGVLAAWTLVQHGSYVVNAAGVVSTHALPAATLSQPGTDLRLAALATGPGDDAVAVLERAPPSASGLDTAQQAILAARTIPGGPGGIAFEKPTQLAAAGSNAHPRWPSTPTATAPCGLANDGRRATHDRLRGAEPPVAPQPTSRARSQ
jgi:hypothetical protein